MRELEEAIQLRSEGKHKQANEMLIKLTRNYPENAVIHYQCAWSFDVMGLESEAVPYYEKSIALGLEGEDLEGALLGLGSTYRTLGEFEKSKATFLTGIERFPTNYAMKVFYSMTLYNLNDHDSSMEILLKCVAETSSDPTIKSYKKAIEFYSDQLDKQW
ncbi:tetratricopeptide repeat protein [Bacillus solimangrovi]|uniref:Tetratrico peptide repeat group 5 domain-containing protein n=1 Tax=Bacillus solimangrovi TaxID=1305675 RepID=A0A1E5LI65_9BACI|nr:tetratricopeptide repeat protein [Bacillus solimangrovi]OEH93770.1 hypothetical protein BFG57_11340 [Bacillus solimangrovi]